MSEPYIMSLVAGIVCAIIEIFTASFLFLGFAIGFVPVALVQYLTGGAVLGRDSVVFAVSALVAVALLRRFVRRGVGKDVNDY